MISNKTLKYILAELQTMLPESQKIVGVCIGGSNGNNFADGSSDLDLCVYLQGPEIDINKSYTLYNYATKTKVECVFHTFYELISKSALEIFGYYGETFYGMSRSNFCSIVPLSKTGQKTILVMRKYEQLGINYCLKGYAQAIDNLFYNAEKRAFNKISLIDAKKLYRVCYMYCQKINSTELSPELLFKVKRNQLAELTNSEIMLLKTAVKTLKRSYTLYNLSLEAALLAQFKREVTEIGK